MTNNSGTLYTGVTSDLERRVYEHKSKKIEGFTKRYNINRLIYFEEYQNIKDAIVREKVIKGWVRLKKLNLIKVLNPKWKDLSEK